MSDQPPPINEQDVARADATAVWHPGEIALQRQVGTDERLGQIGDRVIRRFMPEQHRQFFEALPFAILGTVDEEGLPWGTIVASSSNLLRSPTPKSLHICARLTVDDPARAGAQRDRAIAVLGIDLMTRRRNRMNGLIMRSDDAGLYVAVRQSFGNCPQYIQRREVSFFGNERARAIETSSSLSERAKRIVREADTFFVASYTVRDDVPEVDVSHRGGRPGFVRIDDDGTLTVPDFAGNTYFNTLGNIFKTPFAGLLFIDFSNGDLVQISGSAELILDPKQAAQFEGAERLWRVRPTKVVIRPSGTPLRFSQPENTWSPQTLRTGAWRTVHIQPE